MITMATLEDLLNEKHSLGLYCIACDRWGDADLEMLVRRGLGDRDLTRTRFRCRDCGEVVEMQVRPPVPAVGAARGYI